MILEGLDRNDFEQPAFSNRVYSLGQISRQPRCSFSISDHAQLCKASRSSRILIFLVLFSDVDAGALVLTGAWTLAER